MSAWKLVEEAPVPGGEGLALYVDGAEAMIRCGGWELMSTRAHHSEEWFAEAALAGLLAPSRILVGGLGLGFTVRAARALLPAAAAIEVVELVEAVVRWHRGPLGHLGVLDDARVEVVVADLFAHLGAVDAAYDALLLDTDNGPSALVRPENAAIYGEEGLRRAAAALRPGGVLAVWSADPSPAFARRLAEAGFASEVIACPARDRPEDPEHTIFLGKKA